MLASLHTINITRNHTPAQQAYNTHILWAPYKAAIDKARAAGQPPKVRIDFMSMALVVDGFVQSCGDGFWPPPPWLPVAADATPATPITGAGQSQAHSAGGGGSGARGARGGRSARGGRGRGSDNDGAGAGRGAGRDAGRGTAAAAAAAAAAPGSRAGAAAK